MTSFPKASRLLAALVLLILPSGCDQQDFGRGSTNPRKEAIYTFAASLCEADLQASVRSSGPMGPPRNHPSRLRAPYPTRADLEATLGQADRARTERVTYTILGGLGKEETEGNLALTWWEKDSTWETYGKKGLEKPGHRDIITAWFDPEGRLKKLYIVHPYGSELIGRHSGFWEWFS